MTTDAETASTPLIRLVYVSQISPIAAISIHHTMRDILAVSQTLNRQDGITGCLISFRACFAQVLEGPADKVDGCYARIVRDFRHVAPTVRERVVIPRRRFARWSMLGRTLSSVDDALLDRAEARLDLDLWLAPTLRVLSLLTTVAELYGDELDRARG